MTDKQIIKLNKITEMSQELGLYEDRPDWRITLQADHIKRLEEELQAKEQECEELAYENYELNELFDRLKAENDGLKIQIKKHNDDMFKNPPEKRFYCKGCTLPYISKKLEQTLTEIKEISYELTNEEYTDFIEGKQKQILQKISECE